MCYTSFDDHNEQQRSGSLFIEFRRVRMAGIEGLHGVIKKTTRDQLRLSVLYNTEKIVPALLYNFPNKPLNQQEPEQHESDPSRQAVFVFKDVVSRAAYTDLNPVVSAMLA